MKPSRVCLPLAKHVIEFMSRHAGTSNSSSSATRAARVAVPLLALLWGLNWTAVKVALNDIAPWTFRTAGLSAGAVLLLLAALLRGQSLSVPAGQRWHVLVSGVLNIAGFNMLASFAQLAGTTSRAAILTFTMPIWSVLLAWWWLHEVPDRQRRWAIGFGVTGLAVLLVPAISAGNLNAGSLLAVGAGLSWAMGTVYLKRHPISAAPFAIAGWQLLVGAAVTATGMACFESLPQLASIGWPARLAFIYHAVLAIALAYFIWFEVVARLPASVAALGTLSVPVVGVLGAMLLLGERPGLSDLAGFALISIAAWAALRPQ